MPLPKFIGIGAPRCGTRWLAQCLAEHPEVSLPRKEVYFFTNPPHRSISEHRCQASPLHDGLSSAADDSLSAAVKELHGISGTERQAMGDSGRNYLLGHCTLDIVVDTYERLLGEICRR